ncbi:MAG TPA: tetratricopeptide repeat protein, partial [Arenicellales bacterium]|nr:tetratricopeptide repeat protein [Arenicellales bacterium]
MSRKNPRRGARARNRAGAGSENPALLWQTAVAAYQQGDPVRARRALKPLLDHPAADGTTFLLGGTLEAQLDNMPRAAQLLEKAVRMSPDSAEAWMSLGNVQHALGRMEEAARAYREAARLAPGNAQVWNNLGVVSEDVGLTRDALDYYDRALAIEPALASALRRRAPVLGRLRWFDPAREAYLDLIERFPDDPTLRLDYAQFLEQANRPDEAAHYLPESDQLADHADRARAEYLRAQLLIREGNLDMALERVRAAQARTGQEFLCYREGVILDRLGRYDEAMEAFQRANRATAKQKDFRRLLAQPLDEYLGGKLEAG